MLLKRGRPSGPTGGATWKLAVLAGGISLAAPAVVQAQPVDGTWQGPGGEWTVGSNWSPAAVPDATASFTNNGAPTSVTISSNASIGTLEFDPAAPAYTFTVRSAATFNITNGITSGSLLLPAFRVDAGATLRIDDLAFVQIDTLADGASGGGAVVVGPPGSTFALLSINGDNNSTFSGTISGTGGLELNGSGITTLTGASNGGNIGTLAGDVMLCNCGPGGLTISSGSLTVEGLMGVAVEGGTLSVVNGGSLQVTNGDLLVASNMVVSGSGSNVTVAGFTGVGIFGPATLTIGDGGTLTSQSGAEIDALFGGTPTATVSGPGSTWNIGGFGLAVGGGSTGGLGALTVTNGGTVNVSGPMTIGDAIDGSSSTLVTGAGSVVNVTGPLVIGDPCDCLVGTLTVADGGVVNAPGSTRIGQGSTLNLGLGGPGGTIVTPAIVNDGQIVANFTDTIILAADISGTGSLTKAGAGTLVLGGTNTYTGATTVNGGILSLNGSLSGGATVNSGGTLSVNGSLAGVATVNSGGTLGGSGRVGGVVANGGTLAPGNSIGTLSINGNLVQNGGTYQVEVNGAGQSDLINVAGSATLNGASVQVLAQSGRYARNTTYTILNAAGGVNGTYAGVTSNFAFLTPSLSYDANNVYLLLFQTGGAFAFGAQTPNQYAVGTALDLASPTATGDFSTVLDTISVLSTQQGPAALDAISGQQYADFGTTNVAGAALFMNTVGQQMALARGGAGGGQRQALAQACEVEACEGTSPWSVWASAIGGLGSVAGNGNSSTLTYNFGGAAAGIDYRLDPRFLVGLSAGYAAGNQWVDSFMGRGWTDTVSVIGYGSFTNAGFYADALAGYAYSGNQMQRQIQFPGLQRTANGSAGANQFLGQIETGYRIGLYAPAAASITPFARLQGSTVTQNAFAEWGANSLSLNVAQQTTNSLRTVFGADLAGIIPLSSERSLALDLRLGWLHEYADTGRPITAAFAGAPSNAFTVYGATPQRDAAVIGFSAGTNIAEATRLYLRYDGEISTGASNHTLNLGLRISW
jgi:outer membrane autotransporter protein